MPQQGSTSSGARGAVRAIQPAGWPRPRGYSNGVLVPAGHDMVFTAGMVGWDVHERIVPGGFVPQFEQALANIVAVVREAGGGPEHIVRMVAFVVDKREYLDAQDAVGAAWRRVIGRHFPAMALVQVAGLVETDARVEIEAVAAIPATQA